jgi:putative endonuclease
MNRRSEGAYFEDLACSYLEHKGYRILDRNVYLMRKELDIVAERDGTIVFVEVKGRRSGRYGLGTEAVDVRKRSHMVKTANAYLERTKLWNSACRFDVISISMDGNRAPRFEHIENAFEAC